MHQRELEAVLRRLAEAEEPMLLFVGPSGAHLVPADTDLVGCYSSRTTEKELREDLVAAGETRG